MPTITIHVRYTDKSKERQSAKITASAKPYGEYVDLGFDGHEPTEVINVYDYENGESTYSGDRNELRGIVREWIEANDNDETDYVVAEIPLSDPDAIRETIKQHARQHPRRWLLDYIENL